MSAPSSWMSAKANGWSSGCCSVGVGHPGPRLDRAGRADLDEVVRELGAGRRVPLQRRDDHLVAVADPEDPLLGQRGHERPDHRSERPLVRERDRALDPWCHSRFPPRRRIDDRRLEGLTRPSQCDRTDLTRMEWTVPMTSRKVTVLTFVAALVFALAAARSGGDRDRARSSSCSSRSRSSSPCASSGCSAPGSSPISPTSW